MGGAAAKKDDWNKKNDWNKKEWETKKKDEDKEDKDKVWGAAVFQEKAWNTREDFIDLVDRMLTWGEVCGIMGGRDGSGPSHGTAGNRGGGQPNAERAAALVQDLQDRWNL